VQPPFQDSHYQVGVRDFQALPYHLPSPLVLSYW
jgi:hypothetical protein